MFDGGTTLVVGGEVVSEAREEAWAEMHRALRSIGAKRARLDARELVLLREAEEMGLFRRRGHATMAAYMVAELECSRHTANEKLRVATELIDLPEIAERFAAGEIGWSAVRELTRVATEHSEAEWLAASEGKSSTEIQQMVKGFRKGARPSAKPDPAIIEDWIGLRVPPAVQAIWRQMRATLDAEAGRRLGDAEIGEIVCKRVLASEGARAAPAFQIAITTCRQCKTAAQIGPGTETPISAEMLARAACDAVLIGDLEIDDPERARWTIPASTRRKVALRDRFTCRVPGCGAQRFLEEHHIVHREHGGTNAASNLLLTCDAHHAAHHDGRIRISGRAPDELVFERLVDAEARRYERFGPSSGTEM